MDHLNKHHNSKTQIIKYKDEKTNKELSYESFNYDNSPNEIIPLLINAINELKEKIIVLEKKNIILESKTVGNSFLTQIKNPKKPLLLS